MSRQRAEYEVSGSVATKQWRLMLGAASATCIANASWFMQPQIINDLITGHGSSESAAGLMVTAEFASMSTASFLIARYARGISYLKISVCGAAVMLAGALFTMYVTHYQSLMIARAVTGLGEGAFLMVSTAAVAHLTNPDKAYGYLNTINILFGTAITFGLPVAAGWLSGANPAFSLLLTILPVLVALTLPMPRDERYNPPTATRGSTYSSWRVTILAVAIFLLAIGSTATWSFFVVLGTRTGLAMAQIDAAVGYSLLVSIPATILATTLGPRYGRFRTMAVMMVLDIIAIFVMTRSTDPLAFRIGTCIVEAGICFLIPYFFGFAAAEDHSGRAAAIGGGAYLLTGAVGPYLAGTMMQYLGANSIAWFFLGANLLSGATFWWLENTMGQKQGYGNVLQPAGLR